MKSGRIGTSRQCVRPAPAGPFARLSPAHPSASSPSSGPPPLRFEPLWLRGHPADLPAGRSVIADGRRFPDVLVGPAAVRVVHGVYRNAADVEDGLAERAVRDPLLARLRERLVSAARARDRADRRAAIRMKCVELPRGQLDDCAFALADDDGLRPGGADEPPSVPGHRFDVVDERAFRNLAEGQRVPSVHVRHAVRDRLTDREPVAGDHEDLFTIEANARERRRVPGRLENVRDNARPAKMRMGDETRMAVTRGPVGRRRAAAAPLGTQILPHQNTPIRMPISSAEKPGFSLMIACFPSLRTNVLTFSTFAWNRSSNAVLTWVRVASRRTRNSRRLPPFRVSAAGPLGLVVALSAA